MTRPKPEPLVLSDQERQVLESWARHRKTAQALALRSRIVLACADGAQVGAVAGDLRISRATAAKWRSRFVRGRLDGLADEPRSGRPRTITDAHVQKVVTATLEEEPPGGQTQWSTRSMAREAAMSQTAISRIWRAFGLKPQAAQTWTFHGDPLLAEEIRGVARRETRSISDEQINNSVHEYAPPAETDLRHDRPKPQRNAMLAAERRDLLIARLRRDGKLVARDLAQELGLSEDSVRRDLRELAAAGLCQRVYGGALPISPALGPVTSRAQIAPESKRNVAARAAQLITPGTTAVLDGGTTALEVVAALPPDLDATIITPSATTAAALASHRKISVLLLGGKLNKQAVAASGAIAAEAASGITADLGLLIMPGIHPTQGLTTSDPDMASLNRIFISRTADTYVMASIEKLGTVCAYKVTGLSEVAGIITDAPADHPAVQQLRDQGINIVAA
jgi:DeoR/GlpR family transcriptional regulator of sugar metabolism/transposase